MRIGFLILRETYLKTMGSLIETCLRGGIEATIFYDDSAGLGSKAYQNISEENLRVFKEKGGKVVKSKINELEEIFDREPVNVLVTHEGYHTLKDKLETVTQLRMKGIKVVSLCHFFEICARPLESLTFFDKTYYLSEFARDLHFQLQSPNDQKEKNMIRYHDQYEVLGSPMFDQLVNIDGQECRQDLGISENQPVVLLFAPVLTSVTLWRYYVWRDMSRVSRITKVLRDKKWGFLPEVCFGPSFYDLMKSINRFCKKNKAILIIKSRIKHEDPSYLTSSADLFFDGTNDVYYPVFSSYKLIAAADLCIGVMTMGVVESVAQSKPTINVSIPPAIDYPPEYVALQSVKRKYLQGVSNPGEEGPFKFRDSLYSLERDQLNSWLGDHQLADLQINAKSVQEYKNRILGISDVPSSERIIDSLISLASQ